MRRVSIIDFDERADERAQLTAALLATEDLTDFLQNLVGLATDAIGANVSCGVTVIRDGQPTTIISSDGRATEADKIQYRLDYGPCLHSARTATTVLIDDFSTDDRWVKFREHAVEVGVRSSLSNPLRALPDAAVGALNLYSSEPGTFDQRRQDLARRYTAEADHAVAVAIRLTDEIRVNRQLKKALESRPVIDQAVGILMAHNRSSARAAFAVLVAASQNMNTKLRDVAARIVDDVAGDEAADRRSV